MLRFFARFALPAGLFLICAGLLRANFLDIPVGAKAAALGGAFSSFPDDGSILKWNPAGLAKINQKQIYIAHMPLWLDTDFSFFSYVQPSLKKEQTFAAGFCRLVSGGFIARQSIFDAGEEFDIAHHAVLLSGARKISNKIYMGANFKFINSRIYRKSAFGYGCDAGLFSDFKENMTAGLFVENLITPSLSWETEREKFSRIFSAGSSYKFKNYLFVLNLRKEKNIPLEKGAGAEYTKGIFSLRGGFNENFRFGAGIKKNSFSFNYCFAFHDLGGNHTFDFARSFGQTRGEKIKKITKRYAKNLSKNYFKKGLEYYNQQKYELALAEWDKALIWTPENNEIKQRLDEVSEQLDILVNRKLLERHLTAGYKFYSQGELRESLKEWESVLLFDPLNERANEYISKIKEKFGDEERRALEEKMLLGKQVRVNVLIEKGEGFLSKDKPNEAIKVFKEALRFAPDHKGLSTLLIKAEKEKDTLFEKYFSKGQDFYGRKNYADAVKNIKYALTFKESEQAIDLLSRIKQESAKELPKVSQSEIDKMYYLSADLYFKQQYEEAGKILDEILKKAPLNENALKLKEKVAATLEVIKK